MSQDHFSTGSIFPAAALFKNGAGTSCQGWQLSERCRCSHTGTPSHAARRFTPRNFHQEICETELATEEAGWTHRSTTQSAEVMYCSPETMLGCGKYLMASLLMTESRLISEQDNTLPCEVHSLGLLIVSVFCTLTKTDRGQGRA